MLIVTPNPAIDHTVRLAELRPGEVIRTGPGASVAGGKGGNVARASRLLGATTTVLALVPEVGRDHLESLYAAEGFDLVTVAVSGIVRTCTAMLEDSGRITLLNEPGARVTAGDWDRLLAAVTTWLGSRRTHRRRDDARTEYDDDAAAHTDTAASHAAGTAAGAGTPELLVCSGSLPPGCPADGYAQVVRAGHAADCEVIVDAATDPLARAIAAGADFVCPNLSEAEMAIALGDGASHAAEAAARREPVADTDDDVPERARAAADRLRAQGAGWVVVTAGSAGAALAGPGTAIWITAPEVRVRNPIGAGDSFLAGVATARMAGRGWTDAVRRGIACGSASVEQDAAGVLDPARVDELERRISPR